MTRRLIVVDVLLLALIGLLAWQLRLEWRREISREQALYRYQVKPVPPPPMPALARLAPFEAGAYAGVAQNNLFTIDRNPNVIVDVEPPKPKPQPPFPVARGVMLWEGAPPTIVLSEKSGGAQKGYHPGDAVGEWKVVSIDSTYVVFGWDGKEYQKRIDELLDRAPIEMASAPAPTPVAAAPAKNNAALSTPSTDKHGPGMDVGGGYRQCNAGDDSPPGTVVDGFKKVVSASPFSGSICRWESTK